MSKVGIVSLSSASAGLSESATASLKCLPALVPSLLHCFLLPGARLWLACVKHSMKQIPVRPSLGISNCCRVRMKRKLDVLILPSIPWKQGYLNLLMALFESHWLACETRFWPIIGFSLLKRMHLTCSHSMLEPHQRPRAKGASTSSQQKVWKSEAISGAGRELAWTKIESYSNFSRSKSMPREVITKGRAFSNERKLAYTLSKLPRGKARTICTDHSRETWK